MSFRLDVADALQFYNQNYDIVADHLLSPGQPKVILGNRQTRACRFCDKTPPSVSFRDRAHAIPQALGNRVLFSAYECDSCNEFFGHGIENDLGIWSKPMRALTRIRGNNGVPVIKQEGDWRIASGLGGLEITANRNNACVSLDEVARTMTFRIPRDPYIPVAVLKAFTKIALTLLPEVEMPHFQESRAWIREADHSKSTWCFPVLSTFQPGVPHNNTLFAIVFRRKEHAEALPYAFLVLSYGNEVFQVMVPTPEKDSILSERSPTIMPFPVPLDAIHDTSQVAWREDINLCGHHVVRNDVVERVMMFENVAVSHIPGSTKFPA